MSDKYIYQKYSINNIFDNQLRKTAVLIAGLRGSGKTIFGKDIIRKGIFKEGYVFSKTGESYDDLSPNTIFMKSVDDDILRSISTRQKEKVKEVYAGEREERDAWCFVFMDGSSEMMWDEEETPTYSEALKEIIIMGRNLKICLVIATQTIHNFISSNLRTNLDVIFFMPGTISGRKLWENCGYNIIPRYVDYGENDKVVYYYDTIDNRTSWSRFHRKMICLRCLNGRYLFPIDINRIIISFIGT